MDIANSRAMIVLDRKEVLGFIWVKFVFEAAAIWNKIIHRIGLDMGKSTLTVI